MHARIEGIATRRQDARAGFDGVMAAGGDDAMRAVELRPQRRFGFRRRRGRGLLLGRGLRRCLGGHRGRRGGDRKFVEIAS